MEERDFQEPVRRFQQNGFLIGYLTAYHAAKMMKSERYKKINERAIEEVV